LVVVVIDWEKKDLETNDFFLFVFYISIIAPLASFPFIWLDFPCILYLVLHLV